MLAQVDADEKLAVPQPVAEPQAQQTKAEASAKQQVELPGYMFDEDGQINPEFGIGFCSWQAARATILKYSTKSTLE
eukprot:SAG11_NODE_4313_length_1952_cov_229.801403_2_plen_77_part_00